MSSYFNEDYYLKSKLAQLHAANELDANGNAYTLTTLKQAIADANMTPESHYQQFGMTERLNPNPYFNEVEYLEAKLNQLKSIGEKDDNGNVYTLTTLKEALVKAGMTAAEHYEKYGSHETDASGNLINPSNAFDANAYAAAKLYQLQTSGTAEEKAQWANKTAADVVQAIADADMSLVSHYEQYGAAEANSGKVALVQTVPVTQRVTNDSARVDITGEIVPANYNAPTEAPKNVTSAEAAPVTKPADMGGLANTTVSPTVVKPAAPVAVPGDKGYVAPPDNLVDTNAKPVVIVPSDDGKPQFGVVGTDGKVNAVDDKGQVTDTVIGEVGTGGTVTPVEPVAPETPPSTGGGNTGTGGDSGGSSSTALTAVVADKALTLSGIISSKDTVTVTLATDGTPTVTQNSNTINITNNASVTSIITNVIGNAVSIKPDTEVTALGSEANPLTVTGQTDNFTSVMGGTGDDNIIIADKADSKVAVATGTGNDTIIIAGKGSVSVDAGAGDDTVKITGAAYIDKLLGGADSNDTLIVTGTDAVNFSTMDTSGNAVNFSGFETLNLADTNAQQVTMTAAQYGQFTTITADATDTITFSDKTGTDALTLKDFAGTYQLAAGTNVVVSDTTDDNDTNGQTLNIKGSTGDDDIRLVVKNDTGETNRFNVDLSDGGTDNLQMWSTNGTPALAGSAIVDVKGYKNGQHTNIMLNALGAVTDDNIKSIVTEKFDDIGNNSVTALNESAHVYTYTSTANGSQKYAVFVVGDNDGTLENNEVAVRVAIADDTAWTDFQTIFASGATVNGSTLTLGANTTDNMMVSFTAGSDGTYTPTVMQGNNGITVTTSALTTGNTGIIVNAGAVTGPVTVNAKSDMSFGTIGGNGNTYEDNNIPISGTAGITGKNIAFRGTDSGNSAYITATTQADITGGTGADTFMLVTDNTANDTTKFTVNLSGNDTTADSEIDHIYIDWSKSLTGKAIVTIENLGEGDTTNIAQWSLEQFTGDGAAATAASLLGSAGITVPEESTVSFVTGFCGGTVAFTDGTNTYLVAGANTTPDKYSTGDGTFDDGEILIKIAGVEMDAEALNAAFTIGSTTE